MEGAGRDSGIALASGSDPRWQRWSLHPRQREVRAATAAWLLPSVADLSSTASPRSAVVAELAPTSWWEARAAAAEELAPVAAGGWGHDGGVALSCGDDPRRRHSLDSITAANKLLHLRRARSLASTSTILTKRRGPELWVVVLGLPMTWRGRIGWSCSKFS